MGFFKSQRPAGRNHICWICSYMALSEELAQEICPFWMHSFRQNHILSMCQVASCQVGSKALPLRKGWDGWPWLTDHGLGLWFWCQLEDLMKIWWTYDPVIAGTGENPWTSSVMIEGMIPISSPFFISTEGFFLPPPCDVRWLEGSYCSWFVEFRGASGVAGSVVQSWNIIVWYCVMGGPFAWLPGLFRIHYWWHYMKSTFCCFLLSELL